MNLTDINVIQYVLDKNGFRFSKSMGQNFLIDPAVPKLAAEACGAGPELGVVEVGPGIGCLTEQLALRGARVLAFELDNRLKPVLAETLSPYRNIEIIFRDVLKCKLSEIIPEKFDNLPVCVCANLPYNITTPLISSFVEAGCFENITVMIQKEAAEKITAKPGSDNYVFFSVLVNMFYMCEDILDVPPSCFIPQPHVDSRIIKLIKREKPLCNFPEITLKLAKGIFNQRRKTLPNVLASVFPEKNKTQWTMILEELGFNPKIRGEKLCIEEMCTIAQYIK